MGIPNNPKPWQFAVNRNYFTNRYEVYGRIFLNGGTKSIHLKPAETIYEEVEEGTAVNPMLHLSAEEATQLMDELWHHGIRPTQGDTSGQLAATQAHLADMRSIALSSMELKK